MSKPALEKCKHVVLNGLLTLSLQSICQLAFASDELLPSANEEVAIEAANEEVALENSSVDSTHLEAPALEDTSLEARALEEASHADRLQAIEEKLRTTGISQLTTDDIIFFARDNLANFSYTLSQLQRFAPTITSQQVLFNLINILDELNHIGEQLGMADWGSSPVIVTGQDLTQQAIKWIRYIELDERSLESFAKWANEATIAEATRAQDEFIGEEKDVDKLLTWNVKVATFLSHVVERRNLDHYAVVTVQTLQGNIAEAITRSKASLSQVQIDSIIATITGGPAVEKFSTFLYARVLEGRAAAEFHLMAKWVLSLAKRIASIKEAISEIQRNQAGEMALELLRKYLASSSYPEVQVFEEILNVATIKNLYHFSEIFADYRWQKLSLEGAKVYRMLAMKVAERLEKDHEEDKVLNINKIIDRLVQIEAILASSIEGVYELQIGKETGILTITDLGDRTLFLGLRYFVDGKQERAQDITFNKVSYDRKKGVWHAQSLEIVNPSHGVATFAIQSLHFFHKNTGLNLLKTAFINMTGRIVFAHQKKNFSAKKVKDFVDLPMKNKDADDFVGVYKNSEVSLVVSRVEDKFMGTITFLNYHVRVNLNYGLLDDRLLRLTSGTLTNGRYAQIRAGMRSDGKLELDYIVSGDKNGMHFVLEKTNENH